MAAESPSPSERDLPPPDPSLDHFARLGLESRFDVSRDALERAYLELSRRFHPDRFATAGSQTRRRAMEASSLLNEAYKTLRDPVSRAEYLVRLGGTDLDSTDPKRGAPAPEQAFLVEMLERRERLERVLGDGADALSALRDEVERELDECLDAAVRALSGGLTREAAFELMTRRYLQRYLDEIEAAETESD